MTRTLARRRATEPDAGYSIRVVANRTGIRADTLRVWERRYGFPRPSRRPGGSRLYSQADVERLVLLSRAIAAGYRPGDVIALDDAEIARLAGGTAAPAARAAPAEAMPTAGAVVEAIRADDVPRARSLLRSAAIALGPRAFVTELAHPLAVRLGEDWACGHIEVRHEHLATELVATQLRVLLAAYEQGERSPTVVLATFPGEAHVLGLEMVALLLAASRASPRILGANTPPEQIALAARALDADVVGISVSAAADRRVTAKHVRALRLRLPRGTALWLGGAGAARLGVRGDGLRIFRSIEELEPALSA